MRGEVIADIDQEAAEIVLVVHWISGVRSEMRLFSAVPQPSSRGEDDVGAPHVLLRALQSATIASSRRRSAGVTFTIMPALIPRA